MTEIRTDGNGDVAEVAVLDAASVHVERLSAGAFRVVVARAVVLAALEWLDAQAAAMPASNN